MRRRRYTGHWAWSSATRRVFVLVPVLLPYAILSLFACLDCHCTGRNTALLCPSSHHSLKSCCNPSGPGPALHRPLRLPVHHPHCLCAMQHCRVPCLTLHRFSSTPSGPGPARPLRLPAHLARYSAVVSCLTRFCSLLCTGSWPAVHRPIRLPVHGAQRGAARVEDAGGQHAQDAGRDPALRHGGGKRNTDSITILVYNFGYACQIL